MSHAKLLSGGAAGMALMLEYTIGMPAGVGVLIINIPLLILSYKKLDKAFYYLHDNRNALSFSFTYDNKIISKFN